MRPKLGVLGVMVLFAWAMKHHYADARADDLRWILTPTTQLVGVLADTTFAWQTGEGYFSRERLFLIEKSCAGVNFMVAAFAMLILGLLHRVRSGASAVQVVAVSLLASFAAAVLVNATRIAVALWLGEHPAALASFNAADVHRVEGIVVYFGGLVLLSALVRRVDRGGVLAGGRPAQTFRRAALPLASYYAVTLGLPVANGAADSVGFVGHALVVLVVPPAVILLWCAVGAVARLERAGRSTG
jgi:exosortase K